MPAIHDWEKVFGEVEHALEERRRSLKLELDGAWEKDPAHSSDVLNRMLAAAGRCETLASLKDRFLIVARAGNGLESEVLDLQARVEDLLGHLETYQAHRAAVSDQELAQLAALFSEELGRESISIDLSRFSSEDVEALKRVLDRSNARMKAGVGVRPVDFGEKGIEMRPNPEAALEADPESPSLPTEALASLFETSASDGLAQELEEETGILLADEVVDLEPTPISPPKEKVKAKALQPSDDEAEDVVFVDDKG